MFGRNVHDAALWTTSEIERKLSVVSTHSASELEYAEDWEYAFGKFTENQSYSQDVLEYPRSGNEPGLVLIFNQETFPGEEERQGSCKDVQDIVTCLSRLGYNITSNHIFTDLTKEEIFESVDLILKYEDLPEINSVLVFVLTHGESANFLNSRTECFRADDLWKKFVECKDLNGKPKMFIIQACKGKENTRLSPEYQDTPLVPNSTFSCKTIHPDMLIVYSTMEGKYAYRHTIDGTWLIQELCRNFTAYGRRDDVLTILTRVSKCICRNYFDQKNSDVIKQIPVVVSTLRKKFYLNRNKDRHLVHTLLEKQTEILELTKNISNKLDYLHGT